MKQLTADERIASLEARLSRQRLMLTILLTLVISLILWLAFMSRYIGWPQASLILRADRVLTKELIVTDDNGDFALFVNGTQGGGTMHLYGSQGKPAVTITSFDQGGGKLTIYNREGTETFAAPPVE